MRKFVTSLIIVLGIFIHGYGQGTAHTENKADQVLRGSGRVNASTLGMEIDIPLGNYPGRGINVPISLSYSSKLWRMEFTHSTPGGIVTGGCRAIHSARYSENSASGWSTSLAVPYIEYVGADNLYNSDGFPLGDNLCDPEAPPDYRQNAYVRRLSIHLPGGESHELRADDLAVIYPPYSNCVDNDPNTYCDPNDPSLQTSWDRTYYAVDGSNIKYVENSATNTYRLLMTDGSFYDFAGARSYVNTTTVRKATKFTDRNGNFTSYNEQTGIWTDTLGRTLSAPIGTTAPAAPVVQTYTMPGMTGNYKFRWKQLKGATAQESALTDFSQALRYRGDKLNMTSNGNWQSIPAGTSSLFTSGWDSYVLAQGFFNPVVLTEIELPTGQSYKFSYDIYGRIEKIYYPTGGEERFVYNQIAPLADSEPGNVTDQANFGVTNRKLYPTSGQANNYEWNYAVTYVAPAGYKVSVTSPDQTVKERVLHRGFGGCLGCTQGAFGYDNGLAGMAYEELSYSNTGQLLTQKLTSWTKTSLPTGGSLPADWHPRVTNEEVIVYDESGNGVSGNTKFEYEGNLSQRETPVLVNKTTQYAFVPKPGGSARLMSQPNDPPDPNPTPVPTPTPSSLTPVKIVETTYMINDPAYPQWVRDIYAGQNMVGLSTVSTTKNGAGTIVYRSETKYDEGSYSPNIGRGNPTNSRIWDNTKGNWDNPNAYIATRAKFDTYGNQYETIDAKGISNITEFDTTHHAFPVKVTSAVPDPTNTYGSNAAFVTEATYNYTTGQPLTRKDANGVETRLEYDPVTLRPRFTRTFYLGNQMGGMSETVYHDETNNFWVKSRSLIDTDKWIENITYFDGLGRAVKSEEINSEGNVFVEKEFDEDGRVKRVSNPFRNGENKYWTTNVYDEASRIKEVVLPDGSKVKTDYGVSLTGVVGTTKQITDQAGKKRKGITDVLQRMVRVIEDPDGQNLNTDYVFDTLGNVSKTIQGEQNRFFSYDSLGRLRYAKQPEQQVNTAFVHTDAITNNNQWSVKYEYDDNGNITQTTDANGVSVEAAYDNFNRLKTRNYSDSTPDVSFYYDGKYLDLNDTVQMATGSVKGKKTGVKSTVSKSNYTSFDDLGRLLTSQQITDGQTYNFGYQYNLTAMVSKTYPSGRVVSFDFNADGELARVAGQTAGGTKTYANSFSYNSAGTTESMRLGNGKWESVKYNERQQVVQIGLGNSAADAGLLKINYDYGSNTLNNGALREQRINFNGLSSEIKQSYIYDDLNRLKSATETFNNGTQSWKQTFDYDRYGNRRFDAANTTTLPSGSTKVTNPDINTSDNRFKKDQDNDNLTDYDYDKNGSVTLDAENRRFVYDAENRLKEFTNTTGNPQTPDAIYYYDGEGNRVKKISPTEHTVFVFDSSGIVAAEYSTDQPDQPKLNYLTADHLGSPRIITDGAGKVVSRHDYLSFGDEVTMTLGNIAGRTSQQGYGAADEIRKQYTGYERDTESGLDYAQSRYYNAAHGRFTSADPLTASIIMKNPQTFNRYSYVLNSPYKFTDPLGLLPEGSRSDGGYCGAEYSSCTDDWGSTWNDVEAESHTDEPEDTPATESTESADSGQEAAPPASPPAPAAEQNEETPDTAEAETPEPSPSPAADVPPTTEGSAWVVKNVDALEKKADGTWDGFTSGNPATRWCATLPQLWNQSQGAGFPNTPDWLMGAQANPDVQLEKGTVLATFDRSTGKYANKPSGNHTVIFLEWVKKEETRSVVYGMAGSGGVNTYTVTTYYMKVIEQGPGFKPRVREILYDGGTFGSTSYFNNAWYYNVVRKK